MAIEKSSEVFKHKLDKLVQVYENDKELTAMLRFYNLYIEDTEPDTPSADRILQYEQILTVFVNNSTEISDKTITELLTVTSIRSQIDILIYQSTEPITDEMYRQFLYSYKYGTIKSFFLDNHTVFTPSYDSQIIQNSEKMKIWKEAFMREFDRFAGIIDDIIEIQDIDVIAEEYLDYIAQLVGFERGDTSLGNSLFREITKNIIEVYRIKGTNYSFELFFNFIGFEIDVIEYWFDKRFYLVQGLGKNPYTKETNKFKFGYYLTPENPTEGYPEGLTNPFVLNRNDITSIRNGLDFNKKLESMSIPELEKMLWVNQSGEADKEDENVYTYFKTNVIEYSIKRMTDSSASEGLSEEDAKTIESYVRFLTPIFVASNVVVNIQPFEDDGSAALLLKDENLLIDGITTSMFIATIAGEILAKLGLDINGVETEYWEWDLSNMDFIGGELENSFNSDMSTLQNSNNMYGDPKPLNAFEDGIEGKITSSSIKMYDDDNFYSDIFNFIVPITKNYTASGQIKTKGYVTPYSQHLGSGIIYTSGGSVLSFNTEYNTSGGISLIENTRNYFVSMRQIPSGGIEITGSSTEKATKNYTASGQIKAKGYVTPYSQHLGSGIIYTGGSSEITDIKRLYRTGGSIRTRGVAEVLESIGYNSIGIVTLSNDGIETIISKNFNPSGSVLTSGTITAEVNREYLSSGGAEVSGIADVNFVLEESPSGDIATSGTANVDIIQKAITSGGVLISGTIIAEVNRTAIVSGAAITSGTANVDIIQKAITSGTATTSGTAKVDIIQKATTSGTATASGTADVTLVI